MTTVEKGLLMGIAVTNSLLFVTGVWSFIICYVLIVIGLALFCYFEQDP
jgi:hypothetical protein